MEVAAKKELVPQLQFPPGYSFVPTEEDLVDVYLRGKIEERELPLDVINEVEILEWQPGSLVKQYKTYGEHKWYFFTKREPSSSNKKKEPNRKVRVPGVKATWKATGSVVEIRAKAKGGQPVDMSKCDIIGTKRILIYHSSDAAEHGKWSMHEYILEGQSAIGKYALCSIQRKQHSEASKGRKKKASMQAEGQMQEEEGEEEEEDEEEISPDTPVELPVMWPKQDHQALVQEHHPLAAYGAPPVLPTPPLQEYPSHLYLNHQLGASVSMHQGNAHVSSFQYNQVLPNREEQPPGFTGSDFFIPPSSSNVDHVPFYQQQEDHNLFEVQNQQLYKTGQCFYQNSDLFTGNTIWNSSSWEPSQHHYFQQENGGAFEAQGKHTNAQYYDQSFEQLYSTLGHTGYGSPGQFTKGDDDSANVSFDIESFLAEIDDVPHQDLGIGTKEGGQPGNLTESEMSSGGHANISNMVPLGESSSYMDAVSMQHVHDLWRC